MKKLLIIGAGYLGLRIARAATTSGWHVTAARRSQPTDAERNLCQWMQLDVSDKRDVLAKLSANSLNYSAVVYAVSAGSASPDAYENAYHVGLKNVLENMRQGPRFLFVSSTGVYRENQGEWVDENTPVFAEAVSPNHRQIVNGERLVLNRPGSIIARLSGIYGPERIRMLNSARSLSSKMHIDEIHYTNRVHVEDAARAILHTLELEQANSIYCVTDSTPAPEHEVLLWVRAELNLPQPEVTFGEDRSGQVTANNKRVANKKLLETGFNFVFPSYREGYKSIISGS